MILQEQNGKKIYSDGNETELKMLEIATNYPGDNSQDFISNNSGYTINNTFSKVRENILNWYPFKEGATICEVGAGMGAITGLLCDKAKKVTAIEMNALRADVIKKRNADKKNLTVISEDINYFETEDKYDYVIFIGVLEYAGIFLTEDNPYEKFIRNVSKLLKEDGILLFAIENRFGIKYFSGAAEDHLQNPFVGIEGYKEKNTAKTFSKAELIEMLNNSGLPYNRFYYVLPDYKFPNIIATDNYVPSYNELQKVPFTYGKNSVLLFNEKDVYKDLIKNEAFGFFANSFLIEASKAELEKELVTFVSARGECKKEYKIITTIDTKGTVRKIPTTKEAEKHIQQIQDNTVNLEKRGINVLKYNLNNGMLTTPFYKGEKADKVFEDSIKTNDLKTICSLVDSLRENIFKSSNLSKSEHNILEESGLYQNQYNYGVILENGYIDMTFYNAFFENGELIFYDQEWCFDNIPANFILYYAIKCTYNRINAIKHISLESILNYAGIGEEAGVYDKLEEYIWSTVLYRQGDIYGEDGYCNLYNSSYTLKDVLQKYKDNESLINKLNFNLHDYETKLEKKEEEIKRKELELSNQKILTQEKEKDIYQNNQQIKKYEEVLCNKEGHIALLLESEREFERFRQSRSWRYMSYIWKINSVILPHGSKRRLAAKVTLKFAKHPVRFLKKLTPSRIKKVIYYLKREGVEGVSKRMNDCLILPQSDNLILKVEDLDFSKKIEDYPTLKVEQYQNPQVSIILPVYNQFEYTYTCIKSIIENTEKVTYEILVADDCSNDLTMQINQIIDGITLINNDENLRFLRNCNNAAKYAKGQYILFLNNDTQVQQDWLRPLVELMEHDKTIGLVGSKLIYPDGRLQEAGGIVWNDASAWNYGNRCDPQDPEYNYVKEVDYISGASIMLPLELWNEIGGFDEQFAPAYYEDSDLAFEVSKRGYKVMYQPLSVVVHFEGISNGTDVTQGQKSYQMANQKKFYEKWKQVLECEHFENGQGVFTARDHSQNKKTILMIDHYVPQFDKDAGSRTVFNYLKLFVDCGFNVKFIGDNFFPHQPYTEVLQQLGIEVLYGNYYSQYWRDWIKENAKYIDFVFLNRPHISIKYIDFLKQNTQAKIIYYGHDLHYLREQREFELTQDSALLKSSQKWKETEFDLIKKADAVYYPSIIEVNEILSQDSRVNVKAIPAYIFENVTVKDYMFQNRKDMMFVGGFGHRPNVDGVKWFVKEVLPHILLVIPEIKLYVLGSNPPKEIKELDSENVIVKGFVDDNELEEFYSQCRLAIVPLRYGAGIKGKVVEAMKYGVPIVTTSIGAEGILGAEAFMIIEDHPENLSNRIIDLYFDKERLNICSMKEYEYINNHFLMKNALEGIGDDFGNIKK